MIRAARCREPPALPVTSLSTPAAWRRAYRHWGHDIGPDDTPLEAGLGFAVAWDKPSGFLGREALMRQREEGVGRGACFSSPSRTAHPLLLHDEPIYRDGELSGAPPPAANGFRTGLSLCLGYVACRGRAHRTGRLWRALRNRRGRRALSVSAAAAPTLRSRRRAHEGWNP